MAILVPGRAGTCQSTDELVDRVIRRAGWLEPVADVVQRAVGKAYRLLGTPGAAPRSALHGTRIAGHALRSALTDLPVGAWIPGVAFDLVAHFTTRIPTEAGDIALAIGLVGALGSVLTGYTDFYDTCGHERRVGMAHELTMTPHPPVYAALVFGCWGLIVDDVVISSTHALGESVVTQ